MNAALRAVVRTAISYGMHVYGVRRGYNGLLNGDMIEMNLRSVSILFIMVELPCILPAAPNSIRLQAYRRLLINAAPWELMA